MIFDEKYNDFHCRLVNGRYDSQRLAMWPSWTLIRDPWLLPMQKPNIAVHVSNNVCQSETRPRNHCTEKTEATNCKLKLLTMDLSLFFSSNGDVGDSHPTIQAVQRPAQFEHSQIDFCKYVCASTMHHSWTPEECLKIIPSWTSEECLKIILKCKDSAPSRDGNKFPTESQRDSAKNCQLTSPGRAGWGQNHPKNLGASHRPPCLIHDATEGCRQKVPLQKFDCDLTK